MPTEGLETEQLGMLILQETWIALDEQYDGMLWFYHLFLCSKMSHHSL